MWILAQMKPLNQSTAKIRNLEKPDSSRPSKQHKTLGENADRTELHHTRSERKRLNHNTETNQQKKKRNPTTHFKRRHGRSPSVQVGGNLADSSSGWNRSAKSQALTPVHDGKATFAVLNSISPAASASSAMMMAASSHIQWIFIPKCSAKITRMKCNSAI